MKVIAARGLRQKLEAGWFPRGRHTHRPHREVLLLRPRSVRSTPIVQRCAVEGGETVLMSVPSYRGGLLAAHSAEAMDYGLLHHIVAVIGIELERLKVERETKLMNRKKSSGNFTNNKSTSCAGVLVVFSIVIFF